MQSNNKKTNIYISICMYLYVAERKATYPLNQWQNESLFMGKMIGDLSVKKDGAFNAYIYRHRYYMCVYSSMNYMR